MVIVKNNLRRNICLNLYDKKALRMKPNEVVSIKRRQVSQEMLSNEKMGYISLTENIIEETETKVMKEPVKKETVKKESVKKGGK